MTRLAARGASVRASASWRATGFCTFALTSIQRTILPPAFAMSSDADPTSIDRLFHHDETKRKLLECLSTMQSKLGDMSDERLKEMCKGSIYTPKQCKSTVKRQLKHMRKRIARTTNATEGGRFFIDDMNQLLLDMQQIASAGLANIHNVRFRQFERGKTKLCM